MEFFRSPENWVAISFLLFVGLLVYLKVPAMLARGATRAIVSIRRSRAGASSSAMNSFMPPPRPPPRP